MTYSAKIILDSEGPNGARLTTFEISIPKWVQAELNTHSMLSKNSASSRAIPSAKLLQRIVDDPVIPVFWGKNQKGMQADEELSGEKLEAAERLWRLAGSTMLETVKGFQELNVHKQIANRVVEAWMFTSVIVTATEWDNFWNLRVHPAAQPELRTVVERAKWLYDNSQPKKLKAGEWHLPYITEEDTSSPNDRLLISAGRCARVSYLTHDGRRAPTEDVRLALDLRKEGHMSPFEHQARALTADEWKSQAEEMARLWVQQRIPVGNLWGWLQFRKTLPNEHCFQEKQEIQQSAGP